MRARPVRPCGLALAIATGTAGTLAQAATPEPDAIHRARRSRSWPPTPTATALVSEAELARDAARGFATLDKDGRRQAETGGAGAPRRRPVQARRHQRRRRAHLQGGDGQQVWCLQERATRTRTAACRSRRWLKSSRSRREARHEKASGSNSRQPDPDAACGDRRPGTRRLHGRRRRYRLGRCRHGGGRRSRRRRGPAAVRQQHDRHADRRRCRRPRRQHGARPAGRGAAPAGAVQNRVLRSSSSSTSSGSAHCSRSRRGSRSRSSGCSANGRGTRRVGLTARGRRTAPLSHSPVATIA